MKKMNLSLFRKRLAYLLLGTTLATTYSCKKDPPVTAPEHESQASLNNDIPTEILDKLGSAGFNIIEKINKAENGYVIEGDIFLSDKQISEISTSKESKNPKTKHFILSGTYISGTPTRTIKIFVNSGFTSYVENAIDAALVRYNEMNLRIKFERTTNSSEADTWINPIYTDAYLGLATWPDNGNPGNEIKISTYFYSANRLDAVSVIAHEIGHTLGYRHTDWYDTNFSNCQDGGAEPNTVDGRSTVQIPGTDYWATAHSWMLACSNGFDRPFTKDDVTALTYVYGRKPEDEYLIGDWNGDGVDDMGLRRGGSFYLDTNADGIADISTSFGNGNSEDDYFVGDWDGDGDDNLALRRGGIIHLDYDWDGYENTTAGFGFGNGEDEYLVGDWDGDGDDNIGVRRGHTLYLDYNWDSQHDLYAEFGGGSTEDDYFVGDWDGDGDDNIGIRRGYTVYLNYDWDWQHNLTFAFGLGNSEDQYLFGDWNGDGMDNLAIRRHNLILKNNNSDGFHDLSVRYGNGTLVGLYANYYDY